MHTTRTAARSLLTRITMSLTLTLASITVMAAPTRAQLFNPGIQIPVPGLPITIPPITLPKPTITSCTPNSAPIGAIVNVNGSSFHRAFDGLIFSGATPWKLSIRDSQGLFKDLPFTTLSSTQLRATIPSGAKTGVLCLRQGTTVRASTVQLTIVVPPPPPPPPPGPGMIRLQNNAQYDLFRVVLDGNDLLGAQQVLVAGSFGDIGPLPSGTHSLSVAFGGLDLSGQPVAPFLPNVHTFSVNVPSNGTLNFPLPPFEVRHLLSRFTQRTWSTLVYFGNDGQSHLTTLTFTLSGGYTWVDNGVVVQTGTVIPVEWQRYGTVVKFKLRDSATGAISQEISTTTPFTNFMINGLTYFLP